MSDPSSDPADDSNQEHFQCSSAATSVHTSHAVNTAVTTTPARGRPSGASVTDAPGRTSSPTISAGSSTRHLHPLSHCPSCPTTPNRRYETLGAPALPTTTECGCQQEESPSGSVPKEHNRSALSAFPGRGARLSLKNQPKELRQNTTTEQQTSEMMKQPPLSIQRPPETAQVPLGTPSDDSFVGKAQGKVSSPPRPRTSSRRTQYTEASAGYGNLGRQDDLEKRERSGMSRTPQMSRIPQLEGPSHDVAVSRTTPTAHTLSRTMKKSCSDEDIARRANAMPPVNLSTHSGVTCQLRKSSINLQRTTVTLEHQQDGSKGPSGNQCSTLQLSASKNHSEVGREAWRTSPVDQAASVLPEHRQSVDKVKGSSRAGMIRQTSPSERHEARRQDGLRRLHPSKSPPSTGGNLQSGRESSHLLQNSGRSTLSTDLTSLKIPSTDPCQQISTRNMTNGTVCGDSLQIYDGFPNPRTASAQDRSCEHILPAASTARTYEESGHSPSSSTSSHPAWRSSEDGYDTPLTSQCSSPVKGPSSPCKAHSNPQRPPALGLDFVQFDGPTDHHDKDERLALAANAIDERDACSSEDDVEHSVRSWPSHPRVDLRDPLQDNNDALEFSDCAEDATPLVRACKAKDPHTAYPFPRICSPTSPLSLQRLPSKLLGHTEQSPSHRRRRVVADTLETPDRFIPARSGTPTKEALLLRRTTKKSRNGATSTSPAFPHCADPFGPASSRTARMAEQFATLRRLPTGAGPLSRAATLVPEARPENPRAVSAGAVWSVSGTIVTEGVASVTDGRGGRVTSGTSAPHYTAGFLHRQTPSEDEVQHSERLAVAMEVEQTARMFNTPPSSSASPFSTSRRSYSDTGRRKTFWNNNAWERGTQSSPARSTPRKPKEVPNIPFRVLDAPQLRDDFYCSLLAYSHTMQCLAVGLGQHVYLWSENRGTPPTHIPDSLTSPFGAHVTSLSFSSAAGGRAILAIGRGDRQITLWSPIDLNPRFSSEQPAPVSCVCFRPNPVKRPSVREPGMLVNTEELLVGDKVGHVYYYSVEWPAQSEVDLFDWQGSMTLLARLECHTQQICGMAWSANGEYFATGSNDNQMFLYESRKLLRTPRSGTAVSTVTVRNGTPGGSMPLVQNGVLAIMPGQEKHLFTLNAAVKAIAFAPWQASLIAAGGGSNDRCIHFFHAVSGATLATIDCYAQVTSLVWSEKRQEIAVTFGFAQPEHPYRVAVFAWPSCRRVVGIPWWGEERALSAVAYPGGPHGGPGQRRQRASTPMSGQARRTRQEGCLVVATSDASIKFHEIWPEGIEQGREKADRGMLGGGSILEDELSPTLLRRTTIR